MTADHRSPLGELIEKSKEYPPLSFDDERKLIALIQEGDDEARELIVLHNVGFVVWYAKKFLDRGVALIDLVHEGVLGVYEAVDDFDLSYEVRFTTYAASKIRRSILGAVFSKELIRKPFNVSILQNEIRKFRSYYLTKNHSEPSPEIVAQKFRIKIESAEILMGGTVFSLEKKYAFDDNSNWSLANVLHDGAESVGDKVERDDLVDLIFLFIDKLVRDKVISPRHRHAYLLRFGFTETGEFLEGKSLEFSEIGALFGVSRQYAGQLFDKTHKKVLEAFGSNRERFFSGND